MIPSFRITFLLTMHVFLAKEEKLLNKLWVRSNCDFSFCNHQISWMNNLTHQTTPKQTMTFSPNVAIQYYYCTISSNKSCRVVIIMISSSFWTGTRINECIHVSSFLTYIPWILKSTTHPAKKSMFCSLPSLNIYNWLGD